jgi:enolase
VEMILSKACRNLLHPPSRIHRAIEVKACDALLLKVSQIGTLTEAATAYKTSSCGGLVDHIERS